MTQPTRPEISRRAVFAGAGAAGALAAVAALVPATDLPAVQADAAKAADKATGGYQLTDHVKQYYATARV